MDEYADEDGNVSMKIRQRFRDTDEIRSRWRVIPAVLPRHEEDRLHGVTLACGTSMSSQPRAHARALPEPPPPHAAAADRRRRSPRRRPPATAPPLLLCLAF